MTYAQITLQERYAISALRKLGCTAAAIARELGRHRRTIGREVRRNAWREDGRTYRPFKAQGYTNRRRRVSRRNTQFSAADWDFVEWLLREDWSPEQIVGLGQLGTNRRADLRLEQNALDQRARHRLRGMAPRVDAPEVPGVAIMELVDGVTHVERRALSGPPSDQRLLDLCQGCAELSLAREASQPPKLLPFGFGEVLHGLLSG